MKSGHSRCLYKYLQPEGTCFPFTNSRELKQVQNHRKPQAFAVCEAYRGGQAGWTRRRTAASLAKTIDRNEVPPHLNKSTTFTRTVSFMKMPLELILCSLLVGNALAQRGRMGGGFRGGFGGFRIGTRTFSGRAGVRFIGNRFSSGAGFSNSGWGYPAYYGDDHGTPIGDAGQSAPGTIVLVPVSPPAPEPPPPPPQPARPVIHEYSWPNVNPNDTAAVFSIVTNDKTVHHATMVWIDRDQLHFVNPNGSSGQLSRASISTDLTYQANPDKNLRSWLP